MTISVVGSANGLRYVTAKSDAIIALYVDQLYAMHGRSKRRPYILGRMAIRAVGPSLQVIS